MESGEKGRRREDERQRGEGMKREERREERRGEVS